MTGLARIEQESRNNAPASPQQIDKEET